jgi:peptidoglycan hydrolase-like protein with peptidoglycan-binding domain
VSSMTEFLGRAIACTLRTDPMREPGAHRDDGSPTRTCCRAAVTVGLQWRPGTGRLVQALDRPVDVDEVFGPMTEQATGDFQSAHRLAVDGVVGPRTRAAMVRALDL